VGVGIHVSKSGTSRSVCCYHWKEKELINQTGEVLKEFSLDKSLLISVKKEKERETPFVVSHLMSCLLSQVGERLYWARGEKVHRWRAERKSG
jgi:hypothetical protein